VEQLFGYFRDCMAAAVGCSVETLLYTSPAGAARVVEDGRKMGLNTVLAAMQILDQTLSRMRYSTQGRILAELAIVQISRLDALDEVSQLIAQLRGGAIVTGDPRPGPAVAATADHGAAKKKVDPLAASPTSEGPGTFLPTSAEESTSSAAAIVANSDTPEPGLAFAEPLNVSNAAKIWSAALSRLSGIIVEHAKHFDSIAVAAPGRLVIHFKPQYDFCRSACDRPEQVARFEQALSDVTGRRMRIEFALSGDDVAPSPLAPAAKSISQHQRLLEVMKHPLVQRAGELFGAEPAHIDDTSGRE
jgi:DNA polymerase III subunit gamma/tau